MYDIYSLDGILRMPSSVKIKQCIGGEDRDGLTLVLYCDNYQLICCRLNKNDIKNDFYYNVDNKDIVLRQIPLNETNGELRSMALNPNNSQLVIIFANSMIFVIDIKTLLNRQLDDNVLRDDVVVIESCNASEPTVITWWTSLDDFSQIAIVGNNLGKIYFINIKTKQEVGSTSVMNSIKEFKIIDDMSSVSLIIYCQNGSQFRHILEESRNRNSLKNKANTYVSTQENHYFNCFITPSEEREPIGPNNCWNFKSTLIDFINDNEDTNQLKSTTLLYQSSLIMNLSEVLPKSEPLGQLVIKLYLNKEFDYNLNAFFAKHLIPKQSYHSIDGIVLTDRLFMVFSQDNCAIISREFSDFKKLTKHNPIVQNFHFNESEIIINFNANKFGLMFNIPNVSKLYEMSADLCLERQEFTLATRFYQLAKTCHKKRVANMLSFGYFSHTFNYIEYLFSTKMFELTDSERTQFANIAVNCLVQQLIEKSVSNDAKDFMEILKVFLKNCLYFDESFVLQLFIDEGLYDLAQYCAQLRSQSGLLVKYLLMSSQLQPKSLNQKFYETILNSNYKVLFNTNQNTNYLNCFTSSTITYSLILHKKLIGKYLRFVVNLLPHLDQSFLVKLAVIFDPRRSSTQLLLHRALTQLKQTYLDSEDIDEQMIEKKDILNVFIFIILTILRNNETDLNFDNKFISIDPFIEEIITKNRKRLTIESVNLSAGVSHSALIRNGCLYLWGKSQFGCCGIQSDYFINPHKIISRPTRLDLFKDILAISVKSISCGSQHTLVLTDFGVYSFGSSRFGQLGVGNDVVFSRNPLIIDELVNKDIVKIECGQYHSLAITSNGKLWAWGWNIHGQLGLGHICHVYTPKVVQFFHNIQIIQAFGGFSHTIALDSNGYVYSFGNGSYGQLGLGNNSKYNIPQKISLLKEPISQISTKYFHTLALSRDNQTLYIWGKNPQLMKIDANCLKKCSMNLRKEILNSDIYSKHLLPQKVDISELNETVIKISSGGMHSLLLTTDGSVYSFGRGLDGQLGLINVKELSSPTKIESLCDINITDIAAGYDYSLTLDISGKLWGFGNNSDSQIGPKKQHMVREKLLEDYNKRIPMKATRRLLSFISGDRSAEQLPIEIDISDDIENYCDSLNYSLDINAMKTSTRFSVIDDNINCLFSETFATYDNQLLAYIIAFYRHDLDLNSLLNRLKSFKSYQLAAFFWKQNNLSFELLEKLFDNSYKNEINDSISNFMLEMVEFTIKTIAKRPDKLYMYQTDIESITSDIEDIAFPAEKLWQKILTYFKTPNDSNSFLINSNNNNNYNNAIDIDITDDTIIVFNCQHFYGIKEFKQIIICNFETDIKLLDKCNTIEVQNMLDYYKDCGKQVWDNIKN
ncbi:uncharacterized protein LOC128960654 [Oppia nitens]|uniref:uncharacterized protein LOC128960654 n=1 Tax=Oppia nitens TaxID=1686743 RepID=UPI0023DAC235|nr:uncharacterized protein LOC128960654 [Oppia nitens]